MRLNNILPFVSVLAGAGITYWFNVRLRRRNRIEDLFSLAIEGMFVVTTLNDYIPSVGPWHRAVTEDERIGQEKEIGREAQLAYLRAITTARIAVAKCVPHQKNLQLYLSMKPIEFVDHTNQVIADLQKGPER